VNGLDLRRSLPSEVVASRIEETGVQVEDVQRLPAGGLDVSARLSRLGALLIDRGVIGAAQLNAAIAEQRVSHRPLRDILVEQGGVTPRDVAEAIAVAAGTPFVDLAEVVIDEEIGHRLPEGLARRLDALPIGTDGVALVVAMSDPGDVLALDDVHLVLGNEIEVVAVERSQLRVAIDHVWHPEAHTHLAGGETEAASAPRVASTRAALEENETVELVYRLLHEAVAQRASDLHIEATDTGVSVRFRVDGVLHDVMQLPKSRRNQLAARVKVMTAMDISDHRLPQDGRMTLVVDERPVDVRAVVLPTAYGETIVLRILDKHQGIWTLDELGMSPSSLARLRVALHHAWGLVVVTGPTGSGKSTTLYAGVAELNDRECNVITVEDPIEYLIPGIKQMQVSRRAGLTFATALRSILRADPDVVLVGEIRDLETVRLAAEAALTGHLVLSTLHTNDAASTPMRLLEMGLEPYLVTSALDCVIAQRLMRRLCSQCKTSVAVPPEQLAALAVDDSTQLFTAHGCEACNQTGYHGRFAIYEIMPITDALRNLIVDRSPADVIRQAAIDEGMETMQIAGGRYVTAGETSLEELTRVLR
jgi:type IV pilus assembly protein PilB